VQNQTAKPVQAQCVLLSLEGHKKIYKFILKIRVLKNTHHILPEVASRTAQKFTDFPGVAGYSK